jgi:hypothetical protein
MIKLKICSVALVGFFGVLSGYTTAQPTLKDAFKSDFLVGVAVNPSQF